MDAQLISRAVILVLHTIEVAAIRTVSSDIFTKLAFAGCGGYEDGRPMRQQLSMAKLGSPFYSALRGS